MGAPETKDQALDLVAAIFVRAGERVPQRICASLGADAPPAERPGGRMTSPPTRRSGPKAAPQTPAKKSKAHGSTHRPPLGPTAEAHAAPLCQLADELEEVTA